MDETEMGRLAVVTVLWDAWAVAAARWLVDRDLLGPWLSALTPELRQEYETAEARHAARMRAAGIPGW